MWSYRPALGPTCTFRSPFLQHTHRYQHFSLILSITTQNGQTSKYVWYTCSDTLFLSIAHFPPLNPFTHTRKKWFFSSMIQNMKYWRPQHEQIHRLATCMSETLSETFCISAIAWIQPWKERLLKDKMTKINLSPAHLCISKQLLQSFHYPAAPTASSTSSTADATFLTVTQKQGCTLSSNQVNYKLQLIFHFCFCFLLEPI